MLGNRKRGKEKLERERQTNDRQTDKKGESRQIRRERESVCWVSSFCMLESRTKR
jgi:hypothetical protein